MKSCQLSAISYQRIGRVIADQRWDRPSPFVICHASLKHGCSTDDTNQSSVPPWMKRRTRCPLRLTVMKKAVNYQLSAISRIELRCNRAKRSSAIADQWWDRPSPFVVCHASLKHGCLTDDTNRSSVPPWMKRRTRCPLRLTVMKKAVSYQLSAISRVEFLCNRAKRSSAILAKARLLDRRHKPIVCPTLDEAGSAVYSS